jgi:hypoxanthine phosphoribosyltransferase
MAKQIYLSWQDLEELVSQLIFKLNTPYDAILAVSRGGIIPGGMIAEALKMKEVLTAAVVFPEETPARTNLSWPRFIQFPADNYITGKKILVVDNLWYQGRSILAVKGRIEAVGGFPELAVVHWKTSSSFFPDQGPDYHAAITQDFVHYPWQRIDDSDYRVKAHPILS